MRLAYPGSVRNPRCQQYKVATLPTKRFSFAPKLRNFSFHFSYAILLKVLAGSSTLPGLSKTAYISVWYAQLKRPSSKSVTYESFQFTDTNEYSPFLVVSDWSGDFHFRNRRPYLQPTLSSSPVVLPHMLHHPRCIMGSPLTRIVHRKLYSSQTNGERSIIWNL